MKPYRLMLPLLLATPALVPVVGAVASNPAFKALEPDGFQILDEVVVEPSPPLSRPSADTLIAQEIEIPRRPSLPPPPPATTVSTVVRLGDTLLKIAQRYGLTMGELLQLNPGLETARLVVGSQIQVVRSAPDHEPHAARPGSGGKWGAELARTSLLRQRPAPNVPLSTGQ
jgi:LysM repeat protein